MPATFSKTLHEREHEAILRRRVLAIDQALQVLAAQDRKTRPPVVIEILRAGFTLHTLFETVREEFTDFNHPVTVLAVEPQGHDLLVSM